MKYLQFYTNTHRHKGQNKPLPKNVPEYRSWLRSGHYLKYGSTIVSSMDQVNNIVRDTEILKQFMKSEKYDVHMKESQFFMVMSLKSGHYVEYNNLFEAWEAHLKWDDDSTVFNNKTGGK